VLADGMHEVGFAETDAAIYKERVVGAGRGLGDSERGGVGELVVRADDEGGEGVAGIHPAGDHLGIGEAGGTGAGMLVKAIGSGEGVVLVVRLLFDSGIRGDVVMRGGFVRRRNGILGGSGEVDDARATENGGDGRLEEAEVIGLDPELVDVVRDGESDLVFVGNSHGDGLKPALIGVLGNMCRNMLSDRLPESLKIRGKLSLHRNYPRRKTHLFVTFETVRRRRFFGRAEEPEGEGTNFQQKSYKCKMLVLRELKNEKMWNTDGCGF
jgi:hypothetical protein